MSESASVSETLFVLGVIDSTVENVELSDRVCAQNELERRTKERDPYHNSTTQMTISQNT